MTCKEPGPREAPFPGRPKNVILLTIDALTYTRLGIGGATPSPSPTLDRLLASGVSFSRAFATGCPTMFVMPSLFTSTFPLDEGGYGRGIRERGTSFVEVLRAAGYRTAGFCTGFYQSRLFGYDRGFDEYVSLFELSLFHKVIRGFQLDYLRSKHAEGVLSFEECVALLAGFLPDYFSCLRSFCEEKAGEVQHANISPSPFLHARCFGSIGDVARVEERRFLADPEGYARRLLQEAEGECIFDVLPTLTRRTDPADRIAGIDSLLAGHDLPIAQPVLGPSGRYVLDNVMAWMRGRTDDRPFFVWSHLIDCHDLNFTSWDVDGLEEEIQTEVDAAARLHGELTHARGERSGNTQYDMAIRYTDAQVARLLDFLDEEGLRNSTLLVLMGDHGGWKNGFPSRPAGTDYMSFYDETYHVPMAFCHPELTPRTVEGLASTIDLAPTLLNLLSLPSPAGYRGKVATDEQWPGRDFVLMEHMASGPCDFWHKPIKLTLRTPEHKIVCETPPVWMRADGALLERYDLLVDPLEQNNLAESDPFPETLQWLVEVAERRLIELHEHNFRPVDRSPEPAPPARGAPEPVLVSHP